MGVDLGSASMGPGSHLHLDEYVQDARQMGSNGFVTPSHAKEQHQGQFQGQFQSQVTGSATESGTDLEHGQDHSPGDSQGHGSSTSPGHDQGHSLFPPSGPLENHSEKRNVFQHNQDIHKNMQQSNANINRDDVGIEIDNVDMDGDTNMDVNTDINMDIDIQEGAHRDTMDSSPSTSPSSASSSSTSTSTSSLSSSGRSMATHSSNSNVNAERRPSSFNTAISHNNTTIFKPFDSQTGQFVAPPAVPSKRHNREEQDMEQDMEQDQEQEQEQEQEQDDDDDDDDEDEDLMDSTRHNHSTATTIRPDESSPPSTSTSAVTSLMSTSSDPHSNPNSSSSLNNTTMSRSAGKQTFGNVTTINTNTTNNSSAHQQRKMHNQIPNHTPQTQAPSFSRVQRSKMRSLSVPTILHSSLRKMSNVAQHNGVNPTTSKHHHHHHHHQQQQQQLPPARLTLKHSNNSSTSLAQANSNSNVSSNSNPNSNSNASQNPVGLVRKKRSLKRDQFSLRNAILMTHRLHSSDSKDISLEERIKYIKTYPTPVPLPPINLQCLKEIDLSEIVKNPQLRHDIVFDPMLQFRPNLDGERGIKKRQIADKYWNDVENEILVYNQRPDVFDENRSRLVPLFNTLKDVLVTIVPQKEVSTVANVLDTELLIQELLKGSLVMSSFSEWLSQLFKHHCAPMRDPWVDKMSLKFKEAEENNSIPTLVEALRLVFQILEAMKLDIANHQIRILRPALLSNTVDFEKQYFQSLLNSSRVDLKSSLKWFADKYKEACSDGLIDPSKPTSIPQLYKVCIRSVISLLSCRKMVKEYPTALSFDHARLILLRADIRQIVCLMVCKLLFKQLVANNTELTRPMKEFIIKSYTTKRLKEEIVSIITDEHGNCRWTKNTLSIAVQLNKVIDQLKEEYLRQNPEENASNTGSESSSQKEQLPQPLPSSSSAKLSLDLKKIDFSTSWLSKQTQPLSDVYGVLEARVFRSLEDVVFKFGECSKDGTVKQDFISMCGNTTNSASTAAGAAATGDEPTATLSSSAFQSPSKANRTLTSKKELEIKESLAAIDMEEFENSYRHLYTVVNFHWSVFGCHYLEYVGDKVEKV